MLRKNFFTAEQVATIINDFHNAGLAPDEVAMMDFAQKMIWHAHTITEQDVANLRTHGFSDAEILDIVLVTSARSFFSKALDALGAEPDEIYLELEPELRQALVKGRPFGD